MSIHWVFNKCTTAVKEGLEQYWAKKWPRLQRLLEPYASALQDVRLTVTCHERNPHHIWYDVHAVIHLPSGTLAAKADDKEPRAALDKTVDILAAEIKRHKDRVRKDYVFKRKARQRAGVSAAGPQATVDDRQAFSQLIRPLLPKLQDHIRRELRVLELEETFHRAELSVADLMDEVLTRAWLNFADRPQKEPLEQWLVDILHDTLQDVAAQEPRPHESVEEAVDETIPSEVPQVDDQEWWTWLLGYEDPTNLGDYVARLKDANISQQIEAADELDHIRSLVSALLPPLQRQAFILNVLEEYEPFEIAMIQDRPESEVRADIEAAKRLLRQQLSEEELGGENASAGDSHAVISANKEN